MKKNIYIYMTVLAVITIAAIIFGSLYHITGWFSFTGMNDGGERNGSGSKADQVSENFEEFHSINIDADVMDLTITTGPDESFEATWNYNIKGAPDVDVEDGTLNVQQKSNRDFRNITMGFFKKNHAEMTITVPEGTVLKDITINGDVMDLDINAIETGNCSVSLDVGDVDIKGFKSSNLTMNTETGDIDLEEVTSPAMTVTSDAGDLDVKNCDFNALSAETQTGSIDIDTGGRTAEYRLILETELGSVEVDGKDCGKQYSNSANSEKKIQASSEIGSIEVY